jgi:signal transduction histidine kinase
MMSHELRTPLNAIMGFSEIIRDQIYVPHSNKKYIELAAFIRQAGGLLSDLISDLLELSALEARGRGLKIEEVEVGGFVRTALQLLQETAAKSQIGLLSDVRDDLPVLSIDRRAAIQCLTNILGNAIKYTPDLSDIRISAEHSGNYVQIHVHDRGAGWVMPSREGDVQIVPQSLRQTDPYDLR